MKLIIGGAYQGKRLYANALFPDRKWIDGTECEFGELWCCEGVYHFETYIRRLVLDGQDTDNLAGAICRKNPDILIISDEIGYGIVPAQAVERKCREAVGRVCTALAAQAEEVHRVVCGIGTVIKGQDKDI